MEGTRATCFFTQVWGCSFLFHSCSFLQPCFLVRPASFSSPQCPLYSPHLQIGFFLLLTSEACLFPLSISPAPPPRKVLFFAKRVPSPGKIPAAPFQVEFSPNTLFFYARFENPTSLSFPLGPFRFFLLSLRSSGNFSSPGVGNVYFFLCGWIENPLFFLFSRQPDPFPQKPPAPPRLPAIATPSKAFPPFQRKRKRLSFFFFE